MRPSTEAIAQLGQQLWEQAGRPEGQLEAYKTRAEVRLLQQNQSNNPQTDAPASTPETSARSGEELN